MEEIKLCSKCGELKPVSEFYKSTRGGCKKCVRAYQNKWYKEHRILKNPPLPDGLRRCSKCREVKPVDQFYRDRSNASGYHHWCKVCSDERREARRKKEQEEKIANREVLPEGHKRCTKCQKVLLLKEFHRYRKGSEKRRSQCRSCTYKYRQKPHVKQAKAAYQRRPEVRKARNARKREKRRSDSGHIAREKAYRQEYQRRDYVIAKNYERMAEYRSRPENRRKARRRTKQWRRENPDRCREQRRIKYLRRKGAEGEHTPEQWETLLLFCDHQCLLCGTTEDLTRDHIIPLAWGGSDRIDNIQPLCHQHNAEKHQSYAVDYRPVQARQWAFLESIPWTGDGL